MIKEKISEKDTNEGLDHFKHRVSQLLYSLKSNSSVLTFSNFFEIKFSEKLPLELIVPFNILSGSIQVKAASLPVIKYEAEKTDIRKFIEIIYSREFTNYKEAQTEIELNKNLTNKTVKLIERAGKELYFKNTNQLNLKDSIIKTIPLTSKIIELFFGKLPGILAEFSGNILSDYLKINRSLPIYNCGPVINEIHTSRINKIKNGKR